MAHEEADIREVAEALVEALYADDPDTYAAVRASVGDEGTGPNWNTFELAGSTMLAGGGWNGGPADTTDPAGGPNPDLDGNAALSILSRAIALVLQARVEVSTTPTGTDDGTKGYRPGKLWIVTSVPSVYVMTSAGTGTATWLDITTGGGGGGSPTGPAGGDLAGTYPNPVLSTAVKLAIEGVAEAAAEAYSDAALAAHVADPDPHVQYQKESEKDSNNGYAGLDGSGLVGAAHLPLATTGVRGAVILATPSADVTPGHVVQANDARLSDARTPSGTIGGDMAGSTWPTLTIASSVITTAARTVLQQATVAAMLSTLGGVPTTRQVATTSPLHGGGALSADLTLTVDDASTSGKGVIQLAQHLGGTAALPTVLGARETGGPTNLLYGAIPDGSLVQRSGSSLVGLGTGTSGSYYDPDALAAGVSTISPTTEFRASGLGSWTNSFNPGGVSGLSQTATPFGCRIVAGPPASGNKLSGYYHNTYPGGDYYLLARFSTIGPGSGRTTSGIALMQGTGTTDDIMVIGYTNFSGSGTAQSVNLGWISHWAAYDTFTADDFLNSSAEVPGGYIGIWVGSNKLTVWMGASPEEMVCVLFNVTMTFTPTKIGILGQGEITTRNRPATMDVGYIRVISSTYPGATYTTPPTVNGALRTLITP